MPTSPEVTVFLKAADGVWTSVGKDISRGVVPESVSLTANESGPDTCSFVLKRRAAVPWPDLLAFNQAEILVGGIPVWGGRVWEAPISDTDEDSIAVSGRGWQYHLDDDLIDKFYVQTDLTAWRDQRSYPTADLTSFVAGGGITSQDGVPVVGFPNNSIVGNAMASGITLDLGPNRTPKRIVVQWGALNGNAAFQLYGRTHTVDNPLTGSASDAISIGHETIATLPSLTTTSGTFATGYRYVSLFIYRDDGAPAGAVTSDHLVKIASVKVFAATAYESGGASILKADTVIKDARAAGCPLLSTSDELITAAAFSIPDLVPAGYQTPRAVMSSANAYEGNLLGVDAQRRVFFKKRDTTPKIEVGEWSGSDFQDATTGSADGLYNRVIVQGTGGDGSDVIVTRTKASSLLTRQGFTRTAVLSVGSPLTTTSAQQIGDLWLAEKSEAPMKGTITVKGQGGCRSIHGGSLHPSELLLYVGARIRLTHLPDPATGAWGRDVTVKAVSYSHDAETATVELDQERGRLETLLERLAIVTTQALR